MAHLALYRIWRPLDFDAVVEQAPIVQALRQSVISGQIAHAYLFSGSHGTGKTTLAKIFARAINCLEPRQANPCNRCAICQANLDGSLLDVVEMDAASNNSVDNIRRITDEVVFMPTQSRYKVYIVDEAHMLSGGAFNALLKTLEEPPGHAVFILATTEPHRLPTTIRSRCQRYEFRRIPLEKIRGRLAEIARQDGIAIEEEALQTIASLAEGALRDAISLLDQAQAVAQGTIRREDILQLAGAASDSVLQDVAEAILTASVPDLLRAVDDQVRSGHDLSRFVIELAQHMRDLLVSRLRGDRQLLLRCSDETVSRMRRFAGKIPTGDLIEAISALSALQGEMRWSSDPRATLDVGLIRLSTAYGMIPAEDAASTSDVFEKQQPTQAKSAKGSEPATKPAVKAAVAAKPADEPVPEPPADEPADEPAAEVDRSEEPTAVEQADEPAAEVDRTEEPPADEQADEPAAAVDWTEELPTDEPADEPAAEVDRTEEPPADEQADEPAAEVDWTEEPPENEMAEAPQSAVERIMAVNPGKKDSQVNRQAADLWQQVLDQLLMDGQMTLYLFSRVARPELTGDRLRLHFSSDHNLHGDETMRSLNVVRAAASRAGVRVEIDITTDAADTTAKPPADDWVNRVKQAAAELDIPLRGEKEHHG